MNFLIGWVNVVVPHWRPGHTRIYTIAALYVFLRRALLYLILISIIDRCNRII